MQKTDKEIFRFPVLWKGWECYSIAFVMEREDGTRYVKMTNHGKPYDAPLYELAVKILEYESVANKTKQAIEIAKGADVADCVEDLKC